MYYPIYRNINIFLNTIMIMIPCSTVLTIKETLTIVNDLKFLRNYVIPSTCIIMIIG